MTIHTNNYLAVHRYMSNLAANPKLNLTESQQKTFQEVLNETTKELSKEYVNTNALTAQNNIWKSIGAAGMNSSGFNELLMSGIYGSFGGQITNPLLGLNNAFPQNSSNATGYLNSFYYPKGTKQSHTGLDLSTLYNHLNTIQNRW